MKLLVTGGCGFIGSHFIRVVLAERPDWDIVNLDARLRKTLSTPLFRARFIALAAILSHPPWTYSGKRLRALIDDHAVEELLLPLLVGNPSIKCREVATAAWNIVKPLLKLKPSERKYLMYIEKGVIRPEGLSLRSDREVERIRSHPAILWKTANVRAHMARAAKNKAD